MNIAQTVTVTVFTKFINFAAADRLRLVSRYREITAVGDDFRLLRLRKNTNKAVLFYSNNVKLSAMLCKTVALSDLRLCKCTRKSDFYVLTKISCKVGGFYVQREHRAEERFFLLA